MVGNWQPLLSAPLLVVAHAFVALSAVFVGIAQFALPKGTTRHRVVGYGWVSLMAFIALSSFGIRGLHPGQFSFVHAVSVGTLVMLPIAVLHARRHRTARHGWAMVGLFTGALVIAGAFTLVPGRIMHRVVFGALAATHGRHCV